MDIETTVADLENEDKQIRDFLEEWPQSRLDELTLEDYTNNDRTSLKRQRNI